MHESLTSNSVGTGWEPHKVCKAPCVARHQWIRGSKSLQPSSKITRAESYREQQHKMMFNKHVPLQCLGEDFVGMSKYQDERLCRDKHAVENLYVYYSWRRTLKGSDRKLFFYTKYTITRKRQACFWDHWDLWQTANQTV